MGEIGTSVKRTTTTHPFFTRYSHRFDTQLAFVFPAQP